MERADGTEREPLTPWLTVNAARLLIYLVIASFASSAFVGLLEVLAEREGPNRWRSSPCSNSG